MNVSTANDNVQHTIPASSIKSSVPKSTITKRNVKAKKGLGAKKVAGLGGKKVTKADFEKLEKSAEEHDQIKSRLSTSSAASERNNALKSEEGSGESLRLAYQDLSIQEKQNNVKLSKLDESKKVQAERLGMGMGRTDGVAHSVAMTTIDQVDPIKSSRKGKYRDGGDTFFDSYSSNRSRRFLWDESDSDDDNSSFTKTDFSYSDNGVKSSDKKPPPSYTVTPIGGGHTADTNIFKSTKDVGPKSSRQRNPGKISGSGADSDVSDKYKGAKAISSDMMFGANRDMSSETRSRNFAGQSSISSDDYYGNAPSRGSNRGHVDGIKDGVRESVRSVAGKLSNIASDLATTIQDRYS